MGKKNTKTANDGYKYGTVVKKPSSVFVNPPQYGLAKTGLEIYKTDEESWAEYVSGDNKESNKTEKQKHDKYTGQSSEDNILLLQGDITDIKHIPYLYVADYEQDYLDMSSNGTVKTDSVPKEWCYKGVPASIKRCWETEDTHWKWDDMPVVHEGFITEQNYSEDGVELKISGRSKLLDRTYKFNFSQMHRSTILEEVIKCAGLTPMIDVTGLEDDIIDFNNLSDNNKSKSSSSSTGKTESTGSEKLDEAIKKAVGDEKQPLKQAKLLDSAFKNHVYYKYYFDVKHPDLDEAWRNANLNCADGANVLCAMFRAVGLNATIIHTSGKDGQGHYIVRVKIDGKNYYTDNASNTGSHTSRAFGEVWGPTSGSEVGKKIPQ